MATLLASVSDIAASHYASEEALLDAYDLQWKAIDIRLEKLRNECERMILEYEVEVKQQMYLRECEDLMRQKQAQSDAQQANFEKELAEKEHRVETAEEEARQFKQRNAETARKAAEDDVEAKEIRKKPVAKRKVGKQLEEPVHEEVEPPKPKAAKKAEQKKKTPATTRPVPRPVSPPVYSPEEDIAEAPSTEDDPLPSVEEEVPAADLAHVANNDLLEMLSQDQGYESEDFGDTSSFSLIHPKSPAMLSPKRLKKKAAFEAAALAKTTASPLRGGAASLADRIMNRIKNVAKQPLDGQLSDASVSPPPMLAPTKRALKRRKTATTTSDEAPVTAQPRATEKLPQPKQIIRKSSKKTLVLGDGAAQSDESHEEREPESEETVQQKEGKKVSKKKESTKKTEVNSRQPKKTSKTSQIAHSERVNTDGQVYEDGADMEGMPGGASAENNEEDIMAKKSEPHIGAITGRSKARQKSAKLAALRAVFEDEDDASGFPDIKTPKVPRKKMGIDGKKKQINVLAAKRAEFQQILSESALTEPAKDDNAQPARTKKRRRQDDSLQRKEPVELEFHTPKPKAKKSKVTRNQFPNDELNIMKSPVPLLRAKIAEKKKEELEAKRKANKRTASERDDADDEDSGYGGPAMDVPTSNVLPSGMLSPSISIKPAITFPTAKKAPDDIAAAASDYASRWINSGLVTRAKKNAVKAARKPATKSPKPASLWGGGPSFFDAFVNTAAPAIPRLKSTSSVPKE